MEPARAKPRVGSSTPLGSVWPWTLGAVVVILALQPYVDGRLTEYLRTILLMVGINIILAVSLNVINGITGQFSIGHAGFMAVGAYVAASITVFGGTALERMAAGGALADGLPPPLNLFLIGEPGWQAQAMGQSLFMVALLAAGIAAALAGVVVGIPTLRLRGDYLAIATLGFGEIVRVVLLNVEVLGGASGFTGAPPYGRIPPYTNFINVYLLALACVLLVTNLKRSAQGRALLAIREDEVAAEAVGIDTTRYKVRAFAFSAFFAGIAGGLLGHHLGLIIPSATMFGFLRSIEVIAMVVLGGSGSTTGVILAAAVLTMLPEYLRDLGAWRMVLYAEILVLMMLFRRQGLLGTRELTVDDWRRGWRFVREHGVPGVLGALRDGVAARWRALRSSLVHAGEGAFSAWLGAALLLAPVLDLLLAWGLRPAAGGARTYAAEIVSSLTALLDQGLGHTAFTAPLGAELQFPLRADLGLSIALLPLILPWWQLSFAVSRGQRGAGWGLVALLGVAVWHGGGLLATGQGGPRAVVEAAVAGALLLALLLWQGVQTARRRRLGAERAAAEQGDDA